MGAVYVTGVKSTPSRRHFMAPACKLPDFGAIPLARSGVDLLPAVGYCW